MKKHQNVDQFLLADPLWREGLEALRELLLDTELEETIKWGMPVYTIENKNVVGIGRFNAYFGIWFYQGVFLKDEAGVLINAQEDKTKGLRQWRTTRKSAPANTYSLLPPILPDLLLKYILALHPVR